jgi:Galactose oxidase-like, Early set domain/Viral BACON domain
MPRMRKVNLALVSFFSILIPGFTSRIENVRNNARSTFTPFSRGDKGTGRSFLSIAILFFSGCSAVALYLLWPSSGVAAAVGIRASATANNGAGATTITVNKPAGTVSGDMMVAGIYVRGQGSSAIVTPPAGWALIRRTNSGSPAGADGSLLSYHKVAGSAEPASYTWTFDISRRALGGIASYSGVNTSTPIDAHGGRANAASTAVTAPSITTTVPDTLLVGLFCLFNDATFTPPAGMTERWDFTVPNPNGMAYEAATEARSGAGATGTRAATSSLSAASLAQLIALKPQAGVNYTLTASPSTVAPGGPLTVSWTAPSGRPTTDWIGLYRVGDPNTSYLSWVYTNGATSGSSSFSAPTQGGQYEFRYLPDNGYTDVARSNAVTVNPPTNYTLTASPSTVTAGGSLTVSWTAPSGRPTTDWIGLYQVGDPNTSYLWWTYTNGATSGSSSLSAPATAGQYEFRYLLNDGFSDAARSNAVTVTAGACSYSISPTGQSFPSGGGTGSVAVTAGAGCSWAATSNATWITISSGGSGSGNGTVGYSVAANTATSSRTGTTTIAGQTFTVTQAASSSDPRSITGEWDPNIITWPNIPIHAHMLPNGKVLTWSDDDDGLIPNPDRNTSDAYIWDVATGTFTYVPINNNNSFCSGHAFLPDGRLLAPGGHISDMVGATTTVIFDYRINSWSRAASEMNAGRWYPTACALSNGEVLVVSGSIDVTGNVNQLPEVFTTSGSWRPLTNAMRSLPLYAWLHVAPNGKVFNSGPDVTTLYLDTSGAGAWTNVATTSNAIYRDYGTSVMYEPGRVLIVGGGDPPTNTAEVINLNAASPTWRSVSSMAFARRLHSATLLPDGKVLVTGGTSSAGFNNGASAVLAAEMWDPQTEGWSTLASMKVKRLYHSTAVLLPDGRVLSGGGGRPAADFDTFHLNAEIYSPPYLFKGARPTISSAPTSVGYGQTFFVQTPEATSITKVTWIRLASVTHCNNMNQRINHLSFSQASGGLNVIAPANSNLCPPGHYMLFILNGNGVPSVAKIIQIN